MAYSIVRKPQMNRVYITGDVSEIRSLLSDLRARACYPHEGEGYWLPLRDERRLRDALKAEDAYQQERKAESDLWEQAKSIIPADYRLRHGAMYGGDIRIGDETMNEPGLQTPKVAWTFIAAIEERVRDLTGTSSINGRISSRQSLYYAGLPDDRVIYRLESMSGFGDDLRETYYLPADVWAQLMDAEVQARKITPEQAREWLARYRGCVGTELYEYAANRTISTTPLLQG